MNVSIVIPFWHRSRKHLDQLVCSVRHQVDEVVVVDVGEVGYIATGNVCKRHDVNFISAPSEVFNMSRCINIGIKRTSASSEAVLCTGSEMLFSDGFIDKVVRVYKKHGGNVFIQAECGMLTTDIVEVDLFGCELDELENIIKPFPPRVPGGAILCASRRWWFSVRGYNERLPFGRADSDIERRADKSRLVRDCVRFEDARCFHQLHDQEQKNRLLGELGCDWSDEFDIVANPDGWGEL